MISECKTGQYIEWCTDIPLGNPDIPFGNQYRETPVFILEENEWFFRFVNCWDDLKLFLELKNKRADLKWYSVKCEIGFKNGNTLSLCKKEFGIQEHLEIWSISPHNLNQSLPPDYVKGNIMKFVFFFEGVTEPLLKLSREKGTTSSELQFLDSNSSLENLSHDFRKMLHDGLDCDAEVKCDGHTWKVHKNVLSIRSKVLQAMLNSDMVEGRTGVITLQDMDVPTVQHFLNYLYCGKLEEVTIETAKQFYEIGDKYAVEGLKKICANYLVNNLTVENVLEILMIAVQHSDSNFKDSVIQFMIEKKGFTNDDLWRDFRQSNPAIAFEVYDRIINYEN